MMDEIQTQIKFSNSDLSKEVEIIVIGAGHAGCEAAFAAARMGCKTLLITSQKETLGLMPCNPAIGGLAKSHLIVELDALGGEMGLNADVAGLQYRTLNVSRGSAVRAVRIQCDKATYSERLGIVAKKISNLIIIEGTVVDLIFETDSRKDVSPTPSLKSSLIPLITYESKISENEQSTKIEEDYRNNQPNDKIPVGVILEDGRYFYGHRIILTAGTAFGGYIWVGHSGRKGGGDARPAPFLPESFRDLSSSLIWRRLKTGTPPRIFNISVDWEKTRQQEGEYDPIPFFSRRMRLTQQILSEKISSSISLDSFRSRNALYDREIDSNNENIPRKIANRIEKNFQSNGRLVPSLHNETDSKPQKTSMRAVQAHADKKEDPLACKKSLQNTIPSKNEGGPLLEMIFEDEEVLEERKRGLGINCQPNKAEAGGVQAQDLKGAIISVPRGTLGIKEIPMINSVRDLSGTMTIRDFSFGASGHPVNAKNWRLIDGYATYRPIPPKAETTYMPQTEQMNETRLTCPHVDQENERRIPISDLSMTNSNLLSSDAEGEQRRGFSSTISAFSPTTEMCCVFFRAKHGQLPCYMTHTTIESHAIIRENLFESALYGGDVSAEGVRYCPSIEDKIVKFGDRDGHHVILEPEGADCPWCYPNGLSNSLPVDVQLRLIRSIPGLEHAELAAPGYAIEYDCIDPRALDARLALKDIPNLFFAGQINGTTGYEEAAAQGFLAGVNAALSVQGREPLLLSRDEAYIGVMVDDLITKGTDEPYRMFTSRAEHRLLLRSGNAHLRLHVHAKRLGIVDSTLLALTEAEADWLRSTEAAWRKDWLDGNGLNRWRLLARDGIDYATASAAVRPGSEDSSPWAASDVPSDWAEELTLRAKYEGYIAHETAQADRLKREEGRRIPADFDYDVVRGLRFEAREKLKRVRPDSLRRASKIPGVNPADVALLALMLKRG